MNSAVGFSSKMVKVPFLVRRAENMTVSSSGVVSIFPPIFLQESFLIHFSFSKSSCLLHSLSWKQS